MATGIIGAITGIAGAIMGYASFRKTRSIKSMDLRIELRKAINELRLNLDQLNKVIEQANGSRRAVAAAMGVSSSSMMDHWTQSVQADKLAVQKLSEEVPAAKDDYDASDFKVLEARLVAVHQIQIQVDALLSKYNAALQSDKEKREHLRQQSAARLSNIINGPRL
jgi:hypothetical protein